MHNALDIPSNVVDTYSTKHCWYLFNQSRLTFIQPVSWHIFKPSWLHPFNWSLLTLIHLITVEAFGTDLTWSVFTWSQLTFIQMITADTYSTDHDWHLLNQKCMLSQNSPVHSMLCLWIPVIINTHHGNNYFQLFSPNVICFRFPCMPGLVPTVQWWCTFRLWSHKFCIPSMCCVRI